MRIKKLREQRKLKQTDVARLLDIPLRTYQNYEREVNEAGSDVICRLADIYGVSTDYIIGYSNAMYPSDAVPVISEDEEDLLLAYRAMGAECRVAVLALAKAIAG